MARKIALNVDTATPFCSFTDYNNSTDAVVAQIQCGMGEFSMSFVGLLSAPTAIRLTHNPTGTVFGEFTFAEIEVCAIDGAGTGATTLAEVRDALAPYFFSNGGGGFTYSLTREITSAEILQDNTGTGLAQGLVLATAPAGKQFEWRLRWRLNAGNTAYTSGGDIQIKIGAIVVAALDVESVTSSTDRSHSIAAGYSIGEYKIPSDGQDFVIYSPSGEFLDGDGTITVTLLYNLF